MASIASAPRDLSFPWETGTHAEARHPSCSEVAGAFGLLSSIWVPACAGTTCRGVAALSGARARRTRQPRLMLNGEKPWQVGISSMVLTFTCAGRVAIQYAVSAMSFAVRGSVPS